MPELWTQVQQPEREAERFGSALALLLVVCSVWLTRRRGLTGQQARWHHDSDFSRVPLDLLCEELERHQAMAARDWIVRFVERHILSQAVLVAIGKRDADENFHFFIAPDEGDFRIMKDPGNNLYFDPPRILTTLSLLEGLGYVKLGNRMSITDLGLELWARLTNDS